MRLSAIHTRIPGTKVPVYSNCYYKKESKFKWKKTLDLLACPGFDLNHEATQVSSCTPSPLLPGFVLCGQRV